MTEIIITDIKIIIIIDLNSPLNINHITLYIIRRTITRGSTVRKNKIRQRLSLEVLIRTSLISLIIALLNTLINTLPTIRTITALTLKKSLKKSFIY